MGALVGIFVGGRARRMGGVPKGLLLAQHPREPIVVRTARLARACDLDVVLVGIHPAYADLGLACVEDDARAVGPLGGLIALLARAEGRNAIAVACDMPLFTEEALLLLARTPCRAPVLAARARGGAFWEPFFARYDPVRVLPVAIEMADRGERRLNTLLAQLAPEPLSLVDDSCLADWDQPCDVIECYEESSRSSSFSRAR